MSAATANAGDDRFKPGDLVRVLVDDAQSSGIPEGAEVEIIAAHSHTVEVHTVRGPRLLMWKDVEAVVSEGEEPKDVYTPAESDEIIDAQLAAIFADDPELAEFLGLVSDSMAPLDESKDATEAATHTTAGPSAGGNPANFVQITDHYGDHVRFLYAEQECEEHGTEGTFAVQINGDLTVLVDLRHVDELIAWLRNRQQFSKRNEGGSS